MRRAIAPALEGRTFRRVEIDDVRLTRPEDPLLVAAELVGERVERVDRRGKYLILRFVSGRALLIHLRMTGTLLREPAAATHVRSIGAASEGWPGEAITRPGMSRSTATALSLWKWPPKPF